MATLLNALKSGLDSETQFVLGETREEFAQLQSEYYDRFAPRTPEERFQLDNVIRNEWYLRRFFRIEPQLWEYHTMRAERGTGVELGEALTKAAGLFVRLQRRITAAEKAYKEAMAELRRLQHTAQPQQTATETPQLASFLNTPSDAPTAPDRAQTDPRARPRLDNLLMDDHSDPDASSEPRRVLT